MIQISTQSRRKPSKANSEFGEQARVLLKVWLVAHQIDVLVLHVWTEIFRPAPRLTTLTIPPLRTFFELISDVESHQWDATGTLLFSDSHWGDTTFIKALPPKKNPPEHWGNY